MTTLVQTSSNELSNNQVKPFFYVSVDGTKEKFPNEERGNPAFTGNTSEELLTFMKDNISGFNTTQFNVSVIYTDLEGSKKRIDSFSTQAPFPLSKQPLVIAASATKQAGAIDKVNPHTLTYNELRAFVKQQGLSANIGSSPTKRDLIKVVENYYKTKFPEVLEKTKEEKVVSTKSKDFSNNTIVTEANVKNNVKNIATEHLIADFKTKLEDVRVFLAKTASEKIALYKDLIRSIGTGNTNIEENLVTNLIGKAITTAEQDIKLTRAISNAVTAHNTIISLEVEIIENTQPTETTVVDMLQEAITEVDEDAYINAMLNN